VREPGAGTSRPPNLARVRTARPRITRPLRATKVAWCEKVLAVEQVEGEAPGPGSRYEVVHRPVPLRPERRMAYECLEWEPPLRIRWREDDGDDLIHVTYELELVGTSTRMTQSDDARLGAPRLLHPLMRAGIGRDVARQLRALKRLLERG
jgi:hypothetical protein